MGKISHRVPRGSGGGTDSPSIGKTGPTKGTTSSGGSTYPHLPGADNFSGFRSPSKKGGKSNTGNMGGPNWDHMPKDPTGN